MMDFHEIGTGMSANQGTYIPKFGSFLTNDIRPNDPMKAFEMRNAQHATY